MGTLLVRRQPAGAATVRDNIAADLGSRVAPDSVDDVLLVASELVSNAVRHSGAAAAADADPFDVQWQLGADEVVVRVQDPSPEPPRLLPPDALRPGGRGLAIVSAIARDWGVQQLATGKQVWARVPVSRLS
jgi:anti-sigma regulatory factor (Ser/Thr protein kinase)